MLSQPIGSSAPWPLELVPSRGVLLLDGYGLDIRVWRGRLRIQDGIGRRRTALLHRATSKLKRLVVLGHTGTLTLEAVRWLTDVGASYLQIDADGRVLAAFGPPGAEHPSLRRAQALALGGATGLAIARDLLRRKLQGQRRVLDTLAQVVELPDRAGAAIDNSLERLAAAPDATAQRWIEAEAAAAYWEGWSALPLRFASRDAPTVPGHWLTFGARVSAITGQPRAATNPANAMANFLYALLESEATLAARIVGLDPGMGVFHVDSRYRNSLAADLMEPIRPEVDRYLLTLLAGRTFGARDFFETRTGVCRVVAPLTRELAASIAAWGGLVLAVAQDVATALSEGATEAPLTHPRRPRRAADPMVRPAPTAKNDPSPRIGSPKRRCNVCGKPVRHRGDRTCSPECEHESRVAHGYAAASKGQAVLAELRARGIDPTQTPEAKEKHAATQSRRQTELRAWRLEHPERPDPELFRREIWPLLNGVTVHRMQLATGLSIVQCWRIKRGRIVPHERWWGLLCALTTSEAVDAPAPAAAKAAGTRSAPDHKGPRADGPRR